MREGGKSGLFAATYFTGSAVFFAESEFDDREEFAAVKKKKPRIFNGPIS